MAEKYNLIQERSFKFAVRIYHLSQYLLRDHKEFVLSKQILKSGTSIGANVEEAIGGQTRADFFAKITIAYKEARETQYWIKLLREVNLIDDAMFKSINDDCSEICNILAKIQKTVKSNP